MATFLAVVLPLLALNVIVGALTLRAGAKRVCAQPSPPLRNVDALIPSAEGRARMEAYVKRLNADKGPGLTDAEARRIVNASIIETVSKAVPPARP